MKKTLLIAALIACSNLVLADTTSTVFWKNTHIVNNEQHIAHMAHTPAVVVTGNGLRESGAAMRMVCTPSNESVIGVKWNVLPELNTITVRVEVDGRLYRKSHTWSTDGTFMYRTIKDSKDLINAMKRGKTITLKFTHEGKTWTASYSLTGFIKANDVFNKSCK